MYSSISTEREEFLYRLVAERLENNIEQAVLKTGDKLLSVRALSKEQGISLSTAYKAYSQLEMKGLIEARPKSGYYVRFTKSQYPKITQQFVDTKLPEQASVDDMLALIFRNLQQEGLVRLSLAAPAPELLPEAKLNRSMAEAIRKSPDSCIGYENLQGNTLLRRQLAKQAFSWGGSIAEDEIVTTQGCMEALIFCLKAVTEAGDTVAIESPAYFGIFGAMKSLGLKVLEVPVHPVTGLDLEYLETALEKVAVKACLFVTNFSNPTGGCMPDERKKALTDLLAAKEIPLIEDDIYGDMYFGKSRPRTCKSFDKKELVLLCSSVSKSLAPGYRVGWCMPGRYMDKVLNTKLAHVVSCATPTHAAIAQFFETGRFDLHMRNLRKALHTQCLRYIQAISTYFPTGVRVSQPQGGYVLWIELAPHVDAFELYQAAIRKKISISPGQLFSTDARFSNFIRISFGMPYSAEIDKSLQVLGQLVADIS